MREERVVVKNAPATTASVVLWIERAAEEVPLPDPPVAAAIPGTDPVPDPPTFGVLMLFAVSMYACEMSRPRHEFMDSMCRFGFASACGRTIWVARSTVCWKRSWARTMKPVLNVAAPERMLSKLVTTVLTLTIPPGICQS